MILRGKTGVIATGRLTKDPEVKLVGAKQSKLAKFGIAAGEGEAAEFLNAVCWRKQADYSEAALKKGDEVFVVGVESTREYEGRDGETKTATDTVVKFIAKQPGGQSLGESMRSKREPGDDMMPSEEIDEDMPF